MSNIYNSDDFDPTPIINGVSTDISNSESLAVDNSDEITQTLSNLNNLATKLNQLNAKETEKNIQGMTSILMQMFLQSRMNNNIKMENMKSKLINRLIEIMDTMTAAEIANVLPQLQMSMSTDVDRAMGGGPLGHGGIQVNINQDNKEINTVNNHNNVYAPHVNIDKNIQDNSGSVSKIVEAMSAFKTLGVPTQAQIEHNPEVPMAKLEAKEIAAEFVEKNIKEDQEQQAKILNEE